MTAIATVEKPADRKENPILEMFMSDAALSYIAPFLPEGTDPKRVAATVLLAVKNDKTGMLRRCTPESLILGVARIQQWGLELGTTAHLLPFKDTDSGTVTATPVADYKGLAELMIGSGAVRHVETHVVYQGDEFVYRLGLEPKIDHVPASPRAKGAAITHAYVILHLPFGRFAFDVMSADDIDEIRQKYSKQWKKGPLPAWYCKKTVLRQIAKTVPKNPRMKDSKLAEALAVMDQESSVEFGAAANLPRIQSIRDDDEDEITVPDVGEREPGDDEFEPTPFDA